MKFRNKKDIKFKTKHIRKAFMTDDKVKYFEKHYRENMNFEDYKDIIGDGKVYYGQAGSGKSTKLCELVKDTEDPPVFAFTNKAIENIKKN